MTFWLAAAAMAALTVGLLVLPLLRRRTDEAEPRRSYDLAVYRDQLAEVERDQARGVLADDQAVAARREIERRLLAAAGPGPAAPGLAAREARAAFASRRSWPLACALALLLPAAALALYAAIGAPNVPSLPFAERQAPDGEPGDLPTLAEGLAQRMAQNPEDPAGWSLLGRTYLNLGRFDEAARAFRQAIERGDDGPAAWANLGESLTAANDGRVVAEARRAFAETLERDGNDPRARYYGGLGLAQEGRTGEALEVWQALAADTPADAPWRALLERQIASSRAALGLPAEQAATAPDRAVPPGPSAGDVAAAAEMTPEERMAFIRSMVERLAGRLAEQPDDLEGWLRLIQAYGVLGERDKAAAALEQATRLTADLPAGAPERTAVERAREMLDSGG